MSSWFLLCFSIIKHYPSRDTHQRSCFCMLVCFCQSQGKVSGLEKNVFTDSRNNGQRPSLLTLWCQEPMRVSRSWESSGHSFPPILETLPAQQLVVPAASLLHSEVFNYYANVLHFPKGHGSSHPKDCAQPSYRRNKKGRCHTLTLEG
jgi:hypothetical protein